jgi:dynein heavy chain
MKMISDWSEKGQPKCFWLPGFFFPQGFLTGVLQNHARNYNIPIDSLSFNFELKNIEEDNIAAIESLGNEDGVLVSGLFLEGARWDREKQLIQDSFPMEMYSVFRINLEYAPHSFHSNTKLRQ